MENIFNFKGRTLAVSQEYLQWLSENQDQLRASASSYDELSTYQTRQLGRTIILPLQSFLSQKADLETLLLSGTSLEHFEQTFDAAIQDSQVDRIVIEVDSPGGSVFGVTELSHKIYNARGKKPIVAVISPMAASAAYQIASAADKVVMQQSGEVGSIGVFAMHTDISEYEKQLGVKRTFVQAGKYKTDGNPHEPLSGSAHKDIQDKVNRYYDQMVKDIARNRGIRRAEVVVDFGGGRLVSSETALKVGMIDEIGTFEEVLIRPSRSKAKMKARLDIIKLRAGICAVDTVLYGMAFVYGTWENPAKEKDGIIRSARFLKGCLDKWFKGKHNVVAYLNHDKTEAIGSERDGSLKLQLNERGLCFELRPYKNTTGNKVVRGFRDGDITGVSPGLCVREKTERRVKDGGQLFAERSVSRASVVEISITGFGKNPRSPHRWVKKKH